MAIAIKLEECSQVKLSSSPRGQRQNDARLFVGRAWLRKVSNPKSAHNGKEFINLVLDDGLGELTVKEGNKLILWPNNKRDGINEKTGRPFQDADYRVSLIMSAV